MMDSSHETDMSLVLQSVSQYVPQGPDHRLRPFF